jgi:ribosomal-protein-alanine N-acetyltransferase
MSIALSDWCWRFVRLMKLNATMNTPPLLHIIDAMFMPETITIRSMTEPDLESVLAIEQASFPTPWRREHFHNEIAASHSFPLIALIDETVAGYVCLMSLFEEAQILNVAVKPNLRGKGVARILMHHALEVAAREGASFISLEVRASNNAAITMYETLGFSRTGNRRNYYGGTEDAVLMEKILQGDS